jgi:hypothetical protein
LTGIAFGPLFILPLFIVALQMSLRARRNGQRIIIAAIISTTIIAPITISGSGFDIMWRTMPKRAPSGSKAMPHFGHLPGPAWRTSLCIGQM